MKDKKREPYVKPMMEKVSLFAEEAVLGGCKTTAGGGIAEIDNNCLLDSCYQNTS